MKVINTNGIQNNVIHDVISERHRQDDKWGEQSHIPGDWIIILGEEYGEVCKAVCKACVPPIGTWVVDIGEYRKELIHVAAVAIAAIECMDRDSRNYP